MSLQQTRSDFDKRQPTRFIPRMLPRYVWLTGAMCGCGFGLIAAFGQPSDISSNAPASAPREPGLEYRWQEVPDESFALVGPSGVVWQLNFSSKLSKPHFHPLQTSDGRPLTWVAPPDHVWHYGLWHSWKYINGVNYWEEDEATRRAEGRTQIAKVEILRRDSRGAAVRLYLTYHPAKEPATSAVMHDQIDLEISVPAADGTYRIRWEQTTRATIPVRLDRTPLLDEPGGKPWGGYAGLSFRANQNLEGVTALNSTRLEGRAAHRQPAEWMMLTGVINGAPAAVTIFAHPGNPRHPAPWYVELQPNHPFWFMNPSLLHDAPLELSPGHPLKRTYLVRVDPARPGFDALAAEYEQFSGSPHHRSGK